MFVQYLSDSPSQNNAEGLDQKCFLDLRMGEFVMQIGDLCSYLRHEKERNERKDDSISAIKWQPIQSDSIRSSFVAEQTEN